MQPDHRQLRPDRFYVYVHRSGKTGEVFYVGKGQTNRMYSTYNRSKSWLSYVAQHGFIAEVLEGNLSNEQATLIEREYITYYGDKLVNVSNTLYFKEYPREIVDLFYYDETSPSCLRWKEDRVDSLGRVRKYKGKVAGSKCGRYYIVETDNSSYMVHRVIYCLHNQRVPQSLEIDHINRDSFDNRITNLKAVTKTRNNINRVLPSKTGEQYVYHILNKGREHYLVKIPIKGRRVEFRFFVHKYSTPVDAFTEAVAFARDVKKGILNECT